MGTPRACLASRLGSTAWRSFLLTDAKTHASSWAEAYYLRWTNFLLGPLSGAAPFCAPGQPGRWQAGCFTRAPTGPEVWSTGQRQSPIALSRSESVILVTSAASHGIASYPMLLLEIKQPHSPISSKSPPAGGRLSPRPVITRILANTLFFSSRSLDRAYGREFSRAGGGSGSPQARLAPASR
jgi:hypothetical protein